MITKDINGNNLSGSYDDYVKADSRDFVVKLLVSGQELDCSIKRMTITKGSCGTLENFSVGSVISSTLNLELVEVGTFLNNSMIEVQVGLFTGSDYEYISVGVFKAVDVKKTAYTTTITAYGHTMASMSGAFIPPPLPSLLNLAWFIKIVSGVDVIFGAGIDDTKYLNIGLPTGTTCYSALQVMANVVGGYAVDTADGKVEIRRYSATPTVSVEAERMLTLPNVAEVDFLISGVKVTVTGQYSYALTTDTAINSDKTYYTRSGSGTSADPYVYTQVSEPETSELSIYYERSDFAYEYGDPIVLYENNPYMSSGLFDIYKTIVGYEYKYGDINLSLGDPRIEGTDVLSVEDVDGSTYIVPCHQVVHTYDGGWMTKITASKPTAQGEGLPSIEPITQRLDNIAYTTAMAQSYAETAKESADSAVRDADTARQKAEEVEVYARQAQDDATEAKSSAETAYVASNSAMCQLGVVENIVGVLEMIQEHGVYQETEDTEPLPNKWYFERIGTSPDYTYKVVTVTGDPSALGLYELSGIDEEIHNYVSSHLVLTDTGLSLRTDQSQYRMDIAPSGILILNGDGMPVASYGETAMIGAENGFHIVLGENSQGVSEIGFYNGRTRVAYMNGSELYVENSLSFGHFTFVERDNGHFTLKLIRSN